MRGLEEAWFERIEGRPRRSFAIAYEPVVDRIFLCLDRGRSFEECVLATSSKRFAGKDWFDVLDYLAWKKIADKHTEGEAQKWNHLDELQNPCLESRPVTEESSQVLAHADTRGALRTAIKF